MYYRQVHGSPINTSKSKQLFSFGKSQRFEKTQRSPCKQAYYTLRNGAITNRTTGFGYGNKATFQNRQGVPPPGSYEQPNQFAKNNIKRRGYSFGHQVKRGPIDEGEALVNPGPGAYKPNKDIFAHISYSMRSKYEDPLAKHGNTLGPGQYSAYPSIKQDGSFLYSKYRNSGAPKLSKSRRFSEQRPYTPGPGQYSGEQKVNINKSGTYFVSKYRSTNAGNFGRSDRPEVTPKDRIPGPGSYFAFSQFANMNKSTMK